MPTGENSKSAATSVDWSITQIKGGRREYYTFLDDVMDFLDAHWFKLT
jgi:hypothetical protein